MRDMVLDMRINAIARAMIQTNSRWVTICHNTKFCDTDVFIKGGDKGMLVAKGKFIDYRIPTYLKDVSTWEVDGIKCDVKYYEGYDSTRVIELRREN